MKHILKLAISALLFLVVFTSMQAQPPGGGERPSMDPVKRAEKQTAMMTEQLTLSEAQAAKVQEINLKYAEKSKAMREANTSGDRTAMREQMTALRTAQDAELKTMLTSDQWAAWEKIQAEQRENRGEWGKKKDQAPPPPPTGGQ
ncbi:MAG: DUF4890 domain-containing protein [Lewinellaceae bacterium]|nr:DUF4890 domain-containing protein [Lewinellaceae bacterium]